MLGYAGFKTWPRQSYKHLKKFYLCKRQKTQTTQLKNEKRIWIDISPKKLYKCPIKPCKNSQHHYPTRKCKTKPQ